MTPEQFEMYCKHYAKTCVSIACVANVSPSSVAVLARELDRKLDLRILKK